MINQNILSQKIEKAAEIIPKAWPLYAFVTSNPLSSFENLHFEEAIKQSFKYYHANGYPHAKMFQQAWEKGWIQKSLLQEELKKENYFISPEESLAKLYQEDSAQFKKYMLNDLDRLMVKWLSMFLDQGQSEWGMPGREKGFYKACLSLFPYDKHIPARKKFKNQPEEPQKALSHILKKYPEEDWLELFQYHLAALPGWTGYIQYRIQNNTEWHQAYPVTLYDYLTIRLLLAENLYGTIYPDVSPINRNYDSEKSQIEDFKKIWLKAWEKTYQQPLINQLPFENTKNNVSNTKKEQPEAQLVFCIDTRSELIRKSIEACGSYETFGYAGFFGIPMDHASYDSGLKRKSCPPILTSNYLVNEKVNSNKNEKAHQYHKNQNLKSAFKELIKTLKSNIPASFGFIENAGLFYGMGLLGRTLWPGSLSTPAKFKENYQEFTEPEIHYHENCNHSKEITDSISIEEKAEFAKAAFSLTGWQNFAPLVVFAGHGSTSSNNPFASSLDCGACAGNHGGNNARMLAKICNDTQVRAYLETQHNINIPDDTIFIAAEHNTTTDEVVLFDEPLTQKHPEKFQNLKNALNQAQIKALSQKTGIDGTNKLKSALKKAHDWAETRPEWGLAGNAAFIIGPRSLTKESDLKGRCFLHSYDWQSDEDGSALEAIMSGPMVVTQWINNHYYFTTVDNNKFGSGSKITQNVKGKFGVVQGNGGDLKTGLPLQSLFKDDETLFHQPLRLTVLIQAPFERVQNILEKNNDMLNKLVKNEWIYLGVINPENENKVSFIKEYTHEQEKHEVF